MNEKFKIKQGTNKIRIAGDRNEPIIKAILSLSQSYRHELSKVLEVIPLDGYKLNIFEHSDEV